MVYSRGVIPHLVTGQALDDVAALYRLTRRPGETDRKLQRRVWFETYEGSEPYVVFVEPEDPREAVAGPSRWARL